MTTRRFLISALFLALLLLIAACRPAGEPVTADEVEAMATSALTGLNDDDYDAWTAHFGTTMKAAVPRSTFATVRDGVFAAVGPFESVASVASEPAQTDGYTRWIVTGNFEKGQLRLVYVIPDDGNRIDGVTFEEAN
jgi:hypothetical protein